MLSSIEGYCICVCVGGGGGGRGSHFMIKDQNTIFMVANLVVGGGGGERVWVLKKNLGQKSQRTPFPLHYCMLLSSGHFNSLSPQPRGI